MKIILALFGVVTILSVAAPAKAEVPTGTYFLMDNKGYDTSGNQVYFCLGNSSCYTVQGIFAFVKETLARLDILDKKVSELQSQAPVPTTSQQVADTGTVTCYGTATKYIICSNTYKTEAYITKLVFSQQTFDVSIKLAAGENEQYARQAQGNADNNIGELNSLNYTVNGVEGLINFSWNSTTGKYEGQ